jgi:cell division protein FtsW (lipid II flippase)
MTTKRTIIVALTLLMFGSLLYVAATIPNADMPQTLEEFESRHVWLVVAPVSGIVLWFWALYDWGTREMAGIPKFLWLLLLIFTMGFGAIAYFAFVGHKPRFPQHQIKTNPRRDQSGEDARV